MVAAWFAINPVVFRKPANDRAWPTRAMFGEELWLIDRPRDAGLAVNAAASAAGLAAVIAAGRHRLVPATVATVAQMVLLLVYWELMTRYFDRHQQGTLASRESAK